MEARNDLEAVDAWISTRSGSIHTAKAYHQEANCLQLWLQYERGSKTLRHMYVADWGDYLAFLQAISASWISRGVGQHPGNVAGRGFAAP